jgi:hypothetical protein
MLRIFLDLRSDIVYNISMNENDISYLVFLIGMCYGFYHYGRQVGIQGAIDYLEEEGILEFDDSEK